MGYSEAENMNFVFNGASFNQDISNWDVSNVKSMSGMFFGAESFNQNMKDWNTSNVTDMSMMFYFADSFNGDISGWMFQSYKHIPCFVMLKCLIRTCLTGMFPMLLI